MTKCRSQGLHGEIVSHLFPSEMSNSSVSTLKGVGQSSGGALFTPSSRHSWGQSQEHCLSWGTEAGRTPGAVLPEETPDELSCLWIPSSWGLSS